MHYLKVKFKTMSQLKSMMNLESEMQVRAAGGLLQVLQDEMLIDPVKNTECGVTLLQIHNISEHSMYSQPFFHSDIVFRTLYSS